MPMQVHLEVFHKKAKKKRLILKRDTTIGRSPNCGLRVGSREVSREHCKICITDTGVFIRDLGSANGTYLNNEAIPANTDTPVPPNSQLAVGPLRLLIRYELPKTTPPETAQADAALKETAFWQPARDTTHAPATVSDAPGPAASEETVDTPNVETIATDTPPAEAETTEFPVAESESEPETTGAPNFDFLADSAPATETPEDDDVPFLAQALDDEQLIFNGPSEAEQSDAAEALAEEAASPVDATGETTQTAEEEELETEDEGEDELEDEDDFDEDDEVNEEDDEWEEDDEPVKKPSRLKSLFGFGRKKKRVEEEDEYEEEDEDEDGYEDEDEEEEPGTAEADDAPDFSALDDQVAEENVDEDAVPGFLLDPDSDDSSDEDGGDLNDFLKQFE